MLSLLPLPLLLLHHTDMAVSSRPRNSDHLRLPRKWSTDDRDPTPDRLRSAPAPVPAHPHNLNDRRVVPVVYYLSRNGHLEHPHFMEVTLSSPQGLYLRDVISRLNSLRGKGIAALYSWSCKRSYRNGFVWHDLAESDFIYPAQGNEYVLKGSELLEPTPSPAPPPPARKSFVESSSTASFRSMKNSPARDRNSSESSSPPEYDELQVPNLRRRNQSWSSNDLSECKVYKAEPYSQSSRRTTATQTEDKRRRMKPGKTEEEDVTGETVEETETEIEVVSISPPTTDSSPETLEKLMEADRRPILGDGRNNSNPTTDEGNGGGGSVRTKASAVLMQLISCGSNSFRDCAAEAAKEQSKLALIGGGVPRGAGNHVAVGASKGFRTPVGVRLEDKEYFSGSLIETKKEGEVTALKRSNSYNGDRISQLELDAVEEEATTKHIPRS
ncbi:Protein SOSEKI 5 [Linum grandiflorum]